MDILPVKYSALRKIFLPAILMACISLPSHSAETLQALRAAYVYNIAKFVVWSDEIAELKLCVLDDDRVQVNEFATLNDKQIANRPLNSIELSTEATYEDLAACNILYVDNSDSLLDKANQVPGLLTIDGEESRDSKDVISFAIVNSKLTFDVDMKLVESKKIHMSSKLLRLAHELR